MLVQTLTLVVYIMYVWCGVWCVVCGVWCVVCGVWCGVVWWVVGWSGGVYVLYVCMYAGKQAGMYIY